MRDACECARSTVDFQSHRLYFTDFAFEADNISFYQRVLARKPEVYYEDSDNAEDDYDEERLHHVAN